jgi:glutaredoxin
MENLTRRNMSQPKKPKELYVFTSPTCSPCHALVEGLLKENIEFKQVDILKEENQDKVVKFHVTTVPTIVSISEDDKATSFRGFQSIADVKRRFALI